MAGEAGDSHVLEADSTLPPGAALKGSVSTESALLSDNSSDGDMAPNSSMISPSTNASLNYFERDEALARAEIAVLATILYLALFGNVFVLVVLRLRRQKLTRMQWFIVHLSLADIFVGIFHVLPQMLMDITNQFYGDDFLCRFVRYVSSASVLLSSLERKTR